MERRSALELIDNQGWSRAWGDFGIGIGIGVITLGRQSGEYSPPALCLALTAISSAISLETTGSGGKVGIRLECVRGGGLIWTYCCNARRSSRSFPTSWRRIRTSLASALLKSFKYLQRSAKGKSIFLICKRTRRGKETYLGVALGENAPVGLFEAIWAGESVL